YLSNPKRAALCPRVSPSEDYVIWQDREILGPHNSSRNVLQSKIFPTSTDPRYSDVSPESVFQSNRESQNGIPTVYDNFPKWCFTQDGNQIYFLTSYNARNYLLHIKRDGNELKIDFDTKFPTDVQAILSVTDDFLLVACSSSSKIPSLQLVDIKTGDFVKILLSKSAAIFEPEPKVTIIPTQLPPDEIMPPSIYVEPLREGKIPLIVIPHGGPHGVLSDSFDHDTTYFLKLGFGVFKVNYTGSTGTWFDTTRNLNGHISKLDVPQVHQLVTELLQSNSKIDVNHVFLCGGSHGGFIVTHLSSQFPDFYKAVVARNPVIDLNANIGTTDITDWVYVECGLPYDESKHLIPTVQSTSDAEKLRLFSPVNLAHQVKCPTLIHLGTKDVRVPMSQGLIYYRTLLSHGKDVKLTIYDDNHALNSTAVRANAKIEIAQFFNRVSDEPVFIE
ncbi:Acylamino-acid-releasing enzyme, partial [Pseudolycoriella hygida]